MVTITVRGPLSAHAIVDAHVQALAEGGSARIEHDGPVTQVARRTAARLGVELVEILALPPHVDAAAQPGADVSVDTLSELPSDPMPWDRAPPAPEPPVAHVEPLELAAMPWFAHDDGQHEMLPAGRSRPAFARPTITPDWGLPWPRPQAPMGGLSIHDPKVWNAPERLEHMREDLGAKGAPSFGAIKPEGSPWLKRMSEL